MPEKMSDRRKNLKRGRLGSRSSSEPSYSSSRSSSTTSSSSSSSDDETDAKDLKPIKEYMNDRKELAAQLFKSVKTEKIRMMLPQTLRRVEFNDLEELCAAELVGMSRTRIMCILNGQDMLQSSNTEDSDNSGPSLEIISDVEFVSDEEPVIKKEGAKSKNQMRARAIRALIRKEEGSTSKNAPSSNPQTSKSANEASNSNVSKEVQARQASLREQLEKIDVLIKHGDDEDVYVVINPAPTIELLSSESEAEDISKQTNGKLINGRASEGGKSIEKEKPAETSGSKVSESISQILTGRDKNVSENEDNDVGARKESGTARDAEMSKSPVSKFTKKGKSLDKDKDKVTKNMQRPQSQNLNLPMSVIENIDDQQKKSPDTVTEAELEDGEIVDNDDEVGEAPPTTSTSPSSNKKMKKMKRNAHIRLREKTKEADDEIRERSRSKTPDRRVPSPERSNSSVGTKKSSINKDDTIVIEESPERVCDSREVSQSLRDREDESRKAAAIDEKSLDIEEIIDLDNYPDDMGVVERSESDSETKEDSEVVETVPKQSDSAASNSNSSETWATRYIQQGDVRNVMKESKIQSEIRKRLRERQKQSKINSSPKTSDQNVPNPTSELELAKTIGSVEEYLALKKFSTTPDPEKTEESKSEACEESNKKTEESTADTKSAKIPAESSNIETETSLKEIDKDNESAKENNSISTNLRLCDIELPSDNKVAAEEDSTLRKFSADLLNKKNEKIPFIDSPELEKEEIVKSAGETEAHPVESESKASGKENTETLEDRSFSSASDSSDDNIIVKIDNINTSAITQTPKNQEEGVSSNDKDPDH
ncbi:hypothetical protein QAD02_014731 [Eretmocerus hayati]|uniref:Uncharacterized protein n=1 Tax=Eretmocerus hayati TaxID=131215 RepID=A0ACC2P6P2_9HYME|nr:hypothetical protein QAD02_014731 [Eretmocerus hayati]